MISKLVDTLDFFEWEGQKLSVKYVNTLQVTTGVKCDVYLFVDDPTRDLGIIKMKPGSKTPKQRVIKGDITTEGYVSGKGKLTITNVEGQEKYYEVGNKPNQKFSVNVGVNEIMQWTSSPDSELIAFEICTPPYEDGRYEIVS